MKVPKSAVARVVGAIMELPDLKRATLYLDRKTTVKCTRQRKFDARMEAETYIVTIGKPNYKERKFIKDCLFTGVPFPVRKIQMKWYRK